MLRRFLLVLFVFSALFKPYALAGQAVGEAERVESPMHLALHLQKKAHHHHDDGSITVDGSDESVKHVAADGMLGAAMGLFLTPFHCDFLTACPPRVAEERAKPEPFLARLKRPPRPGA